MNYLKKAKQFRTKKKLGQNFLIDSNIIQKIISEAALSKDETVIEIGSGLGFVTEELAKIVKKVIAIEIDPDAIRELNSLPYSNIDIINKDILKTDIFSLVDVPVKIVANIPYYITSPILAHLLGEIDQTHYKNRESIKEILLMVQYEVAKRIIANEKSPSKEYGLLSILLNYWTIPELIMKVNKSSFYPAPKVDSAILKLKIRQKPAIELENPNFFRKIIQASFGMRRKNIKNALTQAGFDQKIVFEALTKANINPNRRGETLSIDEFKELTSAFDIIKHEQALNAAFY
ncbi:MAG: 16S rRNA (adenine(1518)-N(6)/adenine(1519)-N(6))-dimethyltransferase RsmA [bacterium]